MHTHSYTQKHAKTLGKQFDIITKKFVGIQQKAIDRKRQDTWNAESGPQGSGKVQLQATIFYILSHVFVGS